MQARQLSTTALCALIAFGQQADPVFKSTTQLVVVDVFARDKSGKDLTNLTKADFTVLEEGKPQQIQIFELQKLESRLLPPVPKQLQTRPADKAREARPQTIVTRPAGEIQYRDKRLMVLFFDLSSMQPPEQIRAEKAALKFIDEQMTPSDMVAVMSFASKLRVETDFTADREKLAEAVKSFRLGEGSALAEEASAGDDTGEDTGAAFEADESEFNIFNTDRKLGALESAAKMLAAMPEKKALVYFSSGVGKTGTENQSQLRSTVNAAVRANISFYPVDARGLTAMIPGGDASKGATKGSGLFSGQSQRRQRDRFADQQETLASLAEDTGGKVFLDNNDLSLGIVQAQADIRSYYIVGYYSTNPAADGRYRRIQVRLNDKQSQAKLDYRGGYFASKSFSKFTGSDKEQQLEEALALGDPVTDLTIALEVNHFRLSKGRYFVPIAVKIPGGEVALSKKGGDSAEIDFIGQIRDSKGRLAGTVRDAIKVKLNAETAAQLEKRNFQYDTGFTLEPGKYGIKFLARENQNGKIGTFETKFTVPELSGQTELLASSIVLASQRESLTAAAGGAEMKKKWLAASPLVDEGRKLMPSITRVFRKDQTLFVYLEVYDPGLDDGAKTPSLRTTLAFYRGRAKAFESEPAAVTEALSKRPGVLPVRFEVPLAGLNPGSYTCQLNVIDEVGRRFKFLRSSFVLLDARKAEAN